MSTIATLGIDLGKNIFHLIGTNKHGRIIFKCEQEQEARFGALH